MIKGGWLTRQSPKVGDQSYCQSHPRQVQEHASEVKLKGDGNIGEDEKDHGQDEPIESMNKVVDEAFANSAFIPAPNACAALPSHKGVERERSKADEHGEDHA